jgi:hypothetical protein
MGDHAQADRRRESDADRERLLQHRMPRVERRHEEHAEERGDAEVAAAHSVKTEIFCELLAHE